MQATLLDISKAQIAHNVDLLRPGVSFVEFASRAYRLPDAYLANRYAPTSSTAAGWASSTPSCSIPRTPTTGCTTAASKRNMIVCVESYVGALDGSDGVKLEQPVLITDDGPEVLSALPLDAADF